MLVYTAILLSVIGTVYTYSSAFIAETCRNQAGVKSVTLYNHGSDVTEFHIATGNDL